MGRSRALMTAVAIALVAPSAAAQYFGQNKVQYRHLDFAVIETEHFDVYYYEGEREAAVDAARMAERAYGRLSRILNHQYRERQPIILFASHSEFQQNNITDIGEATGGVTDAFRHRVMLPFTGSYDDFDHVLQHELVHQFQYDIFARGRIGAGIQRLVAVQPPLWLFEGMAEYLSTGPITPLTATWLRNAALEGHLPTIEEMTYDPSVFPYRYGHALMAYIGERWGDEVIGEILHGVASAGVESAFRRALGMSLEDLSEEWHFAIRRTYLPQVAELAPPREFARPTLRHRGTGARIHVSPALSPDGSQIAYLSEGGTYFIDLYVADAETGRVQGRLVKSAFNADFENLRYLNSAGSWSADGKYFAIAAKHGGKDDLVIFDMTRRREHRRIALPLHGATTPAWSPDGTQLVFTGYDGGLSDLYLVNLDGSDLRRLTADKYADLQPAWSPDGRTIAFATDRGEETNLASLRFAALRLALYDLETGRIEVLSPMQGRNINPQWAPDGQSLAYVSDRTGIANIFLYELTSRLEYQLTNVYTGVTGITELSPAISWAHRADRLVFSYYEGPDFTYNVYRVDDPRGLKRQPWSFALPPAIALDSAPTPPDSVAGAPPMPTIEAVQRASIYRSSGGFRSSAATPVPAASAGRPVSVRELLDSATLALPDTLEFGRRRYSGRLTPDYIAQPTIGYARDNFGRGFFGGTAISLSDMLGNRRMLLAGQVNGRIDEAQLLLAYGNFSHRTSWQAGYEQYPLFFYSGSTITTDSVGQPIAVFGFDRLILRQAFVEAHRPFNRFRRVEFGWRAVNIGRARQEYVQTFDPVSGAILSQDVITDGLGSSSYLQPSLALVFDNSISPYVGPSMGRRSRLEYAPAIGGWQFHQVLGDYRRYDGLFGPFVLATRTLFFGRFGRDDGEFPIFLGTPELIRGYTAGSFRRNECTGAATGTITGCAALDQLLGSRVGVFNAELRFPLFRALMLGFLPVWFPPIEGAVFFDAGIAWNAGNRVVLERRDNANVARVRQPLTSWGFSWRVNALGVAVLRFDYAKPLVRADGVGAYWTISIGPTF
ncbi:MAG TPA: DPP IV N-terminal domain-containing protein [Gemmatimonadales bacterium]